MSIFIENLYSRHDIFSKLQTRRERKLEGKKRRENDEREW